MPPKIRIFLLEWKVKTRLRIKIRAPNEQTLNPSRAPNATAIAGKDKLLVFISPKKGILMLFSIIEVWDRESSRSPAAKHSLKQLSSSLATLSSKPIKYLVGVKVAGTRP